MTGDSEEMRVDVMIQIYELDHVRRKSSADLFIVFRLFPETTGRTMFPGPDVIVWVHETSEGK